VYTVALERGIALEQVGENNNILPVLQQRLWFCHNAPKTERSTKRERRKEKITT